MEENLGECCHAGLLDPNPEAWLMREVLDKTIKIIFIIIKKKKKTPRVRETVEQLRALAGLPEDLSHLHRMAHNPGSSSSRISDAFFRLLWVHVCVHTHDMFTHTYAQMKTQLKWRRKLLMGLERWLSRWGTCMQVWALSLIPAPQVKTPQMAACLNPSARKAEAGSSGVPLASQFWIISELQVQREMLSQKLGWKIIEEDT